MVVAAAAAVVVAMVVVVVVAVTMHSREKRWGQMGAQVVVEVANLHVALTLQAAK